MPPNEAIEHMLDDVISWVITEELAEGYTDDMLVEAIGDGDTREEAKKIIIEKLEEL